MPSKGLKLQANFFAISRPQGLVSQANGRIRYAAQADGTRIRRFLRFSAKFRFRADLK
jgi:hypothetical protein